MAKTAAERIAEAVTTIHTEDTLKSVRETLCVAMTSVGQMPYPADYKRKHVALMQRLCFDIDVQRPLGSDGKHGDLHTPTCGCDQEDRS